MPDAVEVIVAWGGTCVHREAARDWCLRQYPWPVRVGQRQNTNGSEGPWCKAWCVMPAVERSSAEIIVLADADVWCERLPEAVQTVADGAAWARPHNSVLRLSHEGTEAFLAGEPWQHLPVDRLPYHGIDGGGIVVARRETFLEIPMDPRFTGWGSEDWSHGFALNTLLGPIWLGNGPLIHLWHPPQEREPGDKHGSPENKALWKRYEKARSYEGAMRELLQEARDALDDYRPALHHRQALSVG